VTLWIARIAWILLPVTMGSAIASATDGWRHASTTTFAVLLYATWAIATLALLAPRPWGFTVLRVAAFGACVLAVWTLGAGDSGTRWIAAPHAIIAAILVVSEPVVTASTNSDAYGNERRFPLRVPPLLLLVAGIAAAVTLVGLAAGPLVIAADHLGIGIVVTLLGWALAAAALRSLHSLDRRFIVLVPAGLVVADAIVLTDPVLLVRERILRVHTSDAAEPRHAIDTRLGAVGGIVVELTDEGSFTVRRGARNTASRSADAVAFTPLRTMATLRACAEHRLPVVQRAVPPPTTTSPS
jgi:hypothetical protein